VAALILGVATPEPYKCPATASIPGFEGEPVVLVDGLTLAKVAEIHPEEVGLIEIIC
jgi:hypothetical protein